MKAFKDGQRPLSGASDWKEAADRYEASSRPSLIRSCPDCLAAYFFLGNSYDNLYKPARKGEPENDAYIQKAIENYTQGGRARSKDPQMQEAGAGVPRRRLRPRQAERPVQGRADRPEDDPDGPERADQLLPLVEDLRGRRPLRGGRSRPCSRPARSSRTTRPSTRRSPASTTARATSTRRWRPSTRPPSSSRTTPGLPPDRQLLLGQGVRRTSG